MSLAESITAKTACHSPSNVSGQVEVGTQCGLPLADKSVGCSLKAGSKSRSVQTTEAVDQLGSTSAIMPGLSQYAPAPNWEYFVHATRHTASSNQPSLLTLAWFPSHLQHQGIEAFYFSVNCQL
ncbi:uncharacterized protein LOC142590503 isoform X4 [Dermacentor variabilis]|uniref:uncharacterized protein LOC142590503 isoform X4 n=1 Tax=Dermacentor variabilis TaxID=34621 RepID=UPI003F5BDEBB